MVILQWLGSAFVLLVAVWGAINPRSLYWGLHAWQYRNPNAAEPSDAVYVLWRVTCIALLVLLAISAIWLVFDRSRLAAQRSAEEMCETTYLQPFRDSGIGIDTPVDEVEAWAAEKGFTVEIEDSVDIVGSGDSSLESPERDLTFFEDDRPVFRYTTQPTINFSALYCTQR